MKRGTRLALIASLDATGWMLSMAMDESKKDNQNWLLMQQLRSSASILQIKLEGQK